MARIVVYANAYRGDVYPFVPIASELSRRGHDVTFVTATEFHEDFAAEPFEVAWSGCDALSPRELDKHAEWVAVWGQRFGGARQLKLFLGDLTVPNLDAFFDALYPHVEGADLLVSHPAAALVGSMVAEAADVPWVDGDLFPMLIPTRTRPPDPLPNLGARANRAMWAFGRSKALAPLTYQKDFAKFRRSKGLDDTERSPLDAMRSPLLSLGLASTHYVDVAPDWPTTLKMTGFSTWGGPNDGQLDADVTAFLDAGEPPVLVTLGTSAASAAPERFADAMRSLDRLGRRGLFLTSTQEIADRLRSQDRAGRHGIWRFAPVASVLPHCCAAVQSGAHGTNALILTAGLPSVISPVLFDQNWHAKRQIQLGTGVYAERPKHLDRAIETMLGDSGIAERARDLGALLRTETGPQNACDAIEAL